MKGDYEKDISENLGDDRNLILLGVRADADIKHRNDRIRELLGLLANGRRYLMATNQDTLSAGDALEAFGFGRDGTKLV